MWKSGIFEIHISLAHTSISWFIPEYMLYLYKGHLVGWFCRESCPFKTADRSGPCVDRRLKRPEALRVFKSSELRIIIVITYPSADHISYFSWILSNQRQHLESTRKERYEHFWSTYIHLFKFKETKSDRFFTTRKMNMFHNDGLGSYCWALIFPRPELWLFSC